MIEFVVPIFLSMGIGARCSRRHVLTGCAIEELKKLITNFFLPMLTFRMFAQAKLEAATLQMVVIAFGLHGLALLLGFALSRAFGEYGRYGPFLMSSAEGGMLGIGLFQMVYGGENLPYLAPFELGQGIFYFTVFLTVLSGRTAPQEHREDRAFRQRAAGIVKTMLSAPVFDGCLFGIGYQLCGLGGVMERLGLADPLYACIDVFSALIMPLILITIGFELPFSRELLLPVAKTLALRFLVMGSCFLVGAGLLRLIGVRTPLYYYALLLECSLPPGFLIVMYVKEQSQRLYLNADISIHVLVTLAISVGFRLFLA